MAQRILLSLLLVCLVASCELMPGLPGGGSGISESPGNGYGY